MKVQVCLQIESKAGLTEGPGGGAPSPALSLTVGPGDTADALRSRVEAVEPIAGAFPDMGRLTFQGETLCASQRLADCGVKEGSSLCLVLELSAKALVQQLLQLLKAGAGAVSVEELGLLYSHKHGVSLGQVLHALGFEAKLDHFLVEHEKYFKLKNGCVSQSCGEEKAASATATKVKVDHISKEPVPVSVDFKEVEVRIYVKLTDARKEAPSEPTVVLPLHVQAGETVANIKKRVMEKEMLPFPDQELLLGGCTLDDSEQLLERLSKEESGTPVVELLVRASEESLAEQLEELLLARPRRASSQDELGLLYCYRHGVPATRALKLLGSKERLHEFLRRHPKHFLVAQGCVTLASTSPNARAAILLDRVVAAASFLNVSRVERRRIAMEAGNANGNGKCSATTAMEATLFLAGLPPSISDQAGKSLLPGLLGGVAAGLRERLSEKSKNGVAARVPSVSVTPDSVKVVAEEGASCVELRLAPSSC